MNMNRKLRKRGKVFAAAACTALLAMSVGFGVSAEEADSNYYLFASSWSFSGSAEDIQSFAYDVETQQLEYIGSYGGYYSMSVLAKDGNLLFVGLETSTEGEDLLLSYRIQEDAHLRRLTVCIPRDWLSVI